MYEIDGSDPLRKGWRITKCVSDNTAKKILAATGRDYGLVNKDFVIFEITGDLMRGIYQHDGIYRIIAKEDVDPPMVVCGEKNIGAHHYSTQYLCGCERNEITGDMTFCTLHDILYGG